VGLATPLSAQPGTPLPLILTSPNESYRVHLDPDVYSIDFFPLSKASDALAALDDGSESTVGNPAGYHDGYVSLGFREPYFSGGDRDVFYYLCSSDECDNGKATIPAILMPSLTYKGRSEACNRLVLGHELFHHVEFAHVFASGLASATCTGSLGKTVCEGQARAFQDKIYSDLDTSTATGCAGFNDEVDDYLENPKQYLWASEYEAALFWTYLMEQHGFETQEPILGADFLEAFWDLVELIGTGTGAQALTDILVGIYGGNLVADFRDFILANAIKDLDLTGLPASFLDRYTYRDDGMAVWTDVDFDGSIVAPASGSTVAPISYPLWGASYYEVDTSACGAINGLRLLYTPLPVAMPGGGLAFPVVVNTAVALQGSSPGRPAAYYYKTTGAWQLNLIQGIDPYERLVIALSSLGPASAQGLLTVVCDTSPLDIVRLDDNPDGLWFGPSGAGGAFPIDVSIQEDGFDSGRGLTGLDPSRFVVTIGGLEARVVAALVRGEGYRLLVTPPPLANGLYDLRVSFDGLATTFVDGARIGPRTPSFLILLDTSSSMLQPIADSRLAALRNAARSWVAQLPDEGRLGVIGFAGDDSEPNDDAVVELALATNDAAQRALAITAIGNLSSGPDRWTSIGDALALAAQQASTLGGFGDAHEVLLISDGSENEGDFWADVEADVLDAGLRVHTVALGGWSDQRLLAEIAAATGGTYRYVAVPGSGASTIELADALGAVVDQVTGSARFFEEDRTIAPGGTSQVSISNTLFVGERDMRVVAQLETRSQLTSASLRQPDDTLVADGVSGARIEVGDTFVVFHVPVTQKGDYLLEIEGSPGATARIQAVKYVPIKMEIGIGSSGDGGASILPQVGWEMNVELLLLDGALPVTSATASVDVAHPDGTILTLPLLDDGGAADRLAGDGIYSARYDRLTVGGATGFADDPSAPEVTTSYGVDASAAFSRPAPAGDGTTEHFFTVTIAEGRVSASSLVDADGDLLPPAYEERHPCLDPSSDDELEDPDDDDLSNVAELGRGLDPCNPDSDGSGESDGSEVRRGGDPLDPTDDALRRPAMLYVEGSRSEHEEQPPLPALANVLRYDRYPEHAAIEVWRAVDGGALQLVDTFDPDAPNDPDAPPGTWLDPNLTPGSLYTYQFRALDEAGNESARSPLARAEAKVDVEAPVAAILLDSGARGTPRTDNETITANIALHFDEPAGTEVRIWALDEPPPPNWQPYASEIVLPIGPAPAVRRVRVRAQLRDAAGNESAIVSQSIEQHPPGSLGWIAGRLAVAPGPQRSALPPGAFVEIAGSSVEPGTETDENGAFLLDELLPGVYDLEISAFGYAPLLLEDVTVVAGQGTDVGAQSLACPADQTFADLAVPGPLTLRAQETVTLGGDLTLGGSDAVTVEASQRISFVGPVRLQGTVRLSIVPDPCGTP
jgi:hypothetical protein